MTLKSSAYYATEKDIFDCLMSARQKFPMDELIELCRARGIFVSHLEFRSDLVKYISLLPHSYYQFEDIAEHIESASRADKVSSVVVPKMVSKTEITEATNILKQHCDKTGDTITLTCIGDKSFLKIAYSEMDYSKTRMRQKRERECTIELDSKANSLRIRKPVNDKVDEIYATFMIKLEQVRKEEIVPEVIDLSSISSPELINEFFNLLIKNIDGFAFNDVTSIKINAKTATSSEDQYDDENMDVNEDESQEQNAEAEQQMIVFIKSASLDGEGLLNSEDYKRLVEKGFFISSVVWQSIEKTSNGPKVEFEALLGKPNEGTGFKYNVRGAYRWRQDHHTLTRRPINEDDKSKYFDLIEVAARKAYGIIQTKVLTSQGNE
jgi:hypothetical protein